MYHEYWTVSQWLLLRINTQVCDCDDWCSLLVTAHVQYLYFFTALHCRLSMPIFMTVLWYLAANWFFIRYYINHKQMDIKFQALVISPEAYVSSRKRSQFWFVDITNILVVPDYRRKYSILLPGQLRVKIIAHATANWVETCDLIWNANERQTEMCITSLLGTVTNLERFSKLMCPEDESGWTENGTKPI